MNIDNIIDLWSEDVKMDSTELDNESLKIPNLHAKWLGILTKERQKLRRLDIKKKDSMNFLSINNARELKIIDKEIIILTDTFSS